MGKRRTSRKLAIQLIFQISEELESLTPEKINYFLKNESASEEAKKFALGFIEGIQPHLTEIDEIIKIHSQNWPLERINKVDRAILRLAFYELAFLKDTPEKVIIDEAIELAKKFSSADSYAFINGLLDAYLKTLRAAPADCGEPLPAGRQGVGSAALPSKKTSSDSEKCSPA